VIRDPNTLREIRDSWQTVVETERTASVTMIKAFNSGIPAGSEPAELFWGLLLIFAFSVLEDALLALRDQGEFSSKSSSLKNLMDNSRGTLIWQAFALADDGRERRNDVAHRRMTFPPTQCEKYIDCIGAELKNWGILI
jgi:hypothetical protein